MSNETPDRFVSESQVMQMLEDQDRKNISLQARAADELNFVALGIIVIVIIIGVALSFYGDVILPFLFHELPEAELKSDNEEEDKSS